MKIYSDLILLRKAVGGLEARSAPGVMFKVKGARDLMFKLRYACDDLGISVYPVRTLITNLPLPVDPNAKRAVKSAATAEVTLRVQSDDGSFVDLTGAGGGLDTDDKAVGKAVTYAWKVALIQGLSLPDQDMIDCDDESDIGGTVVATVTTTTAAPKATPPKKAAIEPSKAAPFITEILASTTEQALESILARARGADLTPEDVVLVKGAVAQRKAKK